MEYLHQDLGICRPGQAALVTLEGDSMNVRLLDAANFQRFQRGDRHEFYGGHATKSPVRLPIPSAGHWYVVVDRGGYAGTVRAQVRLLG